MAERRDEPPEGSWLDEISLSTKIVVLVTVLAVGGYMVVVLADLFF
jgi:hypothetical protein